MQPVKEGDIQNGPAAACQNSGQLMPQMLRVGYVLKNIGKQRSIKLGIIERELFRQVALNIYMLAVMGTIGPVNTGVIADNSAL